MSIKFNGGEENRLRVEKVVSQDGEQLINLVDRNSGGVHLKLKLVGDSLVVDWKSESVVEDDKSLEEKLSELILELSLDGTSIGLEDSETEDEVEETPYDPEKIRVETKQFSLRQIFDMMNQGDIDLTPDFQRHLVWDNQRKSRLIESILLRIPLPMFYFAQDEEGLISVVDGLQRLSTIKEFMKNEFKLKGLEYLEEKCGGKYYRHESSPSIDPKYFRWFNMTQITVNVIDPSSPMKLKYDVFRRINTGGKPLNSQEIRNCLASRPLRELLRKMANLDSFLYATDGSVKDVRMEDQEMALRFILFYRKYAEDITLSNYSGNIDSELNTLTEELSRRGAELDFYVDLFNQSMKNAVHLFGDYCFRKIRVEHLAPNARRQQINKALFVSWSVLLSSVSWELVRTQPVQSMVMPLAERITDDEDLFMFLTYGTNSRANTYAAFQAAKELISANLNL